MAKPFKFLWQYRCQLCDAVFELGHALAEKSTTSEREADVRLSLDPVLANPESHGSWNKCRNPFTGAASECLPDSVGRGVVVGYRAIPEK